MSASISFVGLPQSLRDVLAQEPPKRKSERWEEAAGDLVQLVELVIDQPG